MIKAVLLPARPMLEKYGGYTRGYGTEGESRTVDDTNKTRDQLIEELQVLRRATERLRSYVALSPLAIFVADANGTYVDANPAACRMLGYSLDELLELGIRDVQSAQPPDPTPESFLELKKNGHVSIEVDLKHKDGHLVRTALTAVSLSQDRFMAFVEDITTRKHAEEQLRQSEARFRTLFENAPLGYQSLDASGNLLEVNETWCRLLGYRKDDVLGRNFSEFLRKDFAEVFAENFPKFKGVGYILGIEFEMIRGDGREILVSFDGRIGRKDDGTFKQTHCVLADISARKREQDEKELLEQQLRQAQKMEAIGQLAGGVAHDFNNMLSTIIGNAELAMSDLPQGDPLRGPLGEISRASDRAAELTRQLLAFSRKQLIEPRVVDLNALLQGLQTMLPRLIGEDIILKTGSRNLRGKIRIDPGQLEQIVLNLAINARDAMPEGGELSIETVDVMLDEEFCVRHAGLEPGAHAKLVVKDTGSGMSTEVLDRIFEPFFTTKELGRGTGLGLATVFGIVKQNDGWIDVDSRVGAGSTFTLYFPCVADEQGVSPAMEYPAPAGGRETVLVVEDEKMVRTLVEKRLIRLGYNVLTASSGEDAIALSDSHDGPIDLLFTDVIMPHMNGRELANELSTSRPQLKVLFTSGYARDLITHRDVLDKGVRFIPKPYRIAVLAQRIRDALEGTEDD